MASATAFNDFAWHDATLLSIRVDRRNPGSSDVVAIDLEWPGGQRQTLQFTDCYCLDMNMNFGVLAPETILAARISDDDPDLIVLRSRWASLGVELNDCQCYEMTTNSTASKIRIFARAFDVHPFQEV